MAHFALINNENKVIQVIVVANNRLLVNGQESEQKGIDWLINDFKIKNQFPACEKIKQTSYNSSIRNKFAGINDEWDEENNLFRSPKPYASWVLSSDKTKYIAPSEMPTDGKKYRWNEEQLEWIEI